MSVVTEPRVAPRGLSIDQRLTLVVFAVAIPMLMLSTVVVWQLANHEEDQSRHAIRYASRPIMSAIDAQLGKYMAVVQALAVSQQLKEQRLAEFRSVAEDALPGLVGTWVTLIDIHGQQLFNTLVSTNEPLGHVSEDEWAAALRGFETNHLQISDVMVGGLLKTPVISVGVPIVVDDQPTYFLAIGVDVNVFQGLLNSQGLPEGWIAQVIDRGGHIIARSRDHDRWAAALASAGRADNRKQDAVFEAIELEGQPVIYASAVSQLSGWATGLAAEKSALNATVRRITLSATLAGSAVILLSSLFAAWASQKITASIRALEKGALALQQRAPVVFEATRVPEVDQALLAFGAASKALLEFEDQRTKAEMVLRSSEERLRVFVEQAPASIAMFDRELRYLAASQRFLSQYHLEQQDVVGRSHYEVLPEMPDCWKVRYERGLEGEVLRGEDEPFLRADGRTQWISWETRPWHSPDGQIGGVVAFADDVTSRHEVVAALRESEERLRLLINGTKDYAVFMLDPQGRIASWNDGARRIKGYDAEEIIGKHFSIFYTAAEIAAGEPERELESALREGRYERECEQVKKTGGRIWASILTNAIIDDSGILKGFAKITQDITERRRAEQALQNSEMLLSAVIDGSPDAVVAIDNNGIIQSINANGLRMFGYERRDVVGRNISMLMPAPYSRLHDEYRQTYQRTGHGKIIGAGREVEGRRKDGSVFPLGLMVTETRHAEAPLFVGFLRDLSSRHEIEARIKELQGERLSAMGGLAAGLAHELNQPLAAAASYIETAEVLIEMPPEARPATIETTLRSAVAEIMRAGQIMKRLRELVTSGEPDKTFISLHGLIRDCCEVAVPQFAGRCNCLKANLNAASDSVLADRIQIKQVLENLTRNALQAMSASEECELSISTSLTGEDMIRVDVADRGPGIQSEVVERLFEPFQTTKRNGMGIGLSVSRIIVEAHYGKIWAEANPGGGAIFSFTLPLADLEINP
jgi:two-component system sensor kinase FixL